MANLTHAESRRLYSWWWDSHISPKNSKWLQENLTDIDAKVKAMIKLIEEDADSFARRAEMYYKKRPDLLKLVEEFYRAYRALAERYDHATGALRQAQRTMAKAFPNQIPFSPADDSSLNYSPVEAEPHTPEISHPIRTLYDPKDLHRNALGASLHSHTITKNGGHSEDSDALTNKKGLKQLNEMFGSGIETDHARIAEGKARKGLKFPANKEHVYEAVAQNIFEDVQKQNSEERNDTGNKMRTLQDKISQLSTDNDNLKTKIVSESDRADKAKNELENLQKALSKLDSEKEAAILQHQQCMESVSSLEAEVSRRQADVVRLNGEILEGVKRFKAAEERLLLLDGTNHSLQSEADALRQKVAVQQQELVNKNEELKKLDICIQEEHIHLLRTEAELQSLQSLHSSSQEEKRMLKLELQQQSQILKDMEFRKHGLEEEIWKYKQENSTLNEQNQSFAMSMKNLQMEIFSLKEEKGKLEEEVRLRVQERNAYQQELLCLGEELDDLQRRHQDVIDQVLSVGLDASCLHSAIKELQDENLKLKEICKGNEHEKAIIAEKLENMEEILEKNALLENSLSDASAEMEVLRERLKTLQESFQNIQEEKLSLVAEKCFLVSQVDSIMQNFEKISEKNNMLEKSLSDVNAELKILREKAMDLEHSCEVLQHDKSSLFAERNEVLSQLETVRECLLNLEKRHADLEDKHSCLEKERESALHCVNQLQISLNLEKEERATYFQSSQTQLISLENQMYTLQEESQCRKQLLQQEQDKIMNAEIEIFLLHRCIHDMKESNLSLSVECLEHIEASLQAKKMIVMLEQDVLEEKSRFAMLQESYDNLTAGILSVLKTLNVDEHHGFPDRSEREIFPLILCKIQEINNSYSNTQDEKQQLLYEKVVIATLLQQLRLDASNINVEKRALEQESEVRMKELLILQSENHKLLELNGELSNNVHENSCKLELLAGEAGMLQEKLSDSHEAYQTLQKENCKVLENNQSLEEKIYDLSEENHVLEEENSSLFCKATSLGNLSSIFNSICCEKAAELKTLVHELEHFHGVCSELEEVRLNAFKVEAENVSLKESVAVLEKFRNHSLILEDELNELRIVSAQLNNEIEIGKNQLSLKEIELSQTYQMLKAEEFEQEELHKQLWELEVKDELLNSALEKVSSRSWTLEDELSKVRIINQQLNREIEIRNKQLSDKEIELTRADKKIEAEEFIREELQRQLWELEFKDEQLTSVIKTLRNHFLILENELNEVRIVTENLYSEVEGGKNQLSQKEMELSVVYQKLELEEFEREKLYEQLWFLELKDEQLNPILEKFRRQVLVLDDELKTITTVSERLKNEVQIGKNLLAQKENQLGQAYQKIKDEEFEREVLCKEVMELKLKEEHLTSLVQEKVNEVELLEETAAALYEDFQIRAVCLALFEEKAHDLMSSCKCLVETSMYQERMLDEERVKTIGDTKKLEENICVLEKENGSLKAELAAYLPLIASLKDSMSSMEDQARSLINLHATSKETQNAAEVDLHHVNSHGLYEASGINGLTGVSELQKLQAQVEAVEKDMKELSKITKKSINSTDRIMSTIDGIEDLKIKSRVVQDNAIQTNEDVFQQVDNDETGKVEMQNGKVDAFKAKNELMMKDIQLDHASDHFSTRENGMDSHEIVWSGKCEADDQMLELWENAERDNRGGSSTADNKQMTISSVLDGEIEYHEVEAVEQKSEYPSSELQIEKVVGIDKLEVRKKDSDSQQGGKMKILERLASDARRLSKLQACAEELDRKFKKSEKGNRLLSFEYDNVKAQLKDVNEAISKLVNVHDELMNNVEKKCPHSKDGEWEEEGNKQQLKVSERARKWSEKIGRLELEVQRIQFVMFKLESEYGGRRGNALDRRRKVVLRDFLYGVRERRRKSKSYLCACARSLSTSD